MKKKYNHEKLGWDFIGDKELFEKEMAMEKWYWEIIENKLSEYEPILSRANWKNKEVEYDDWLKRLHHIANAGGVGEQKAMARFKQEARKEIALSFVTKGE